ncbi:hypothetical protein CSUI_005808 [Cystoisospora suis]|uniref:Uncharacterized protein n=1 Tax=Cystoisospora suis TaxID=483139 RepID=A0A2C6KTY0_9APIC|nr:hypothetical protein CSUI_005808 [Cystoisospora suis]
MEGKDGGGEENNNDNVQFYFDSAAGRWWYFDEEQQSWLPWEEESEEGKESVTPKKTSTSPDKAGLNSKREQGEEVEDHAQSLQQREERNTPRQLQEALDPSSQQESGVGTSTSGEKGLSL